MSGYPPPQQPPYQQPYYQPQPPPNQGMSNAAKFFLAGCLGAIVLFGGSCVACSLLFSGAADRIGRINTNSTGAPPSGIGIPNPPLTNTESKWIANESESEMDSSKSYGVGLQSENEIEGWLKKSKPILYVRCKERKIEVYISMEMAASVEYGGGHSVRLRFDDGQPVKQNWSQSTDNEALFFKGDAVGLAKKIAQTQTFKFEFVPFNGSPQVAQFDVRGFPPHLDKLLSTCKKK
jgi:type VI secretion system protein VasI